MYLSFQIYAPQINLLLVFWSMCYAWSWIHFEIYTQCDNIYTLRATI